MTPSRQLSAGKRRVRLGSVLEAAAAVADRIVAHKAEITSTLTAYETWSTACDEIDRALATLRGLDAEAEHIERAVPGLRVATFLPINQPLYALVLFGVVPALLGHRVAARPSEVTGGLVRAIHRLIATPAVTEALAVVEQARSRFVTDHVGSSDVTIFTGTHRNGAEVLRRTCPASCFIFNGSGVNPIVVGPGADLGAVTEAVQRSVTYNSGQDCAAPDCVLVHDDVADDLVARLSARFSRLVVGPNTDRRTEVGPLHRVESLLEYAEYASRHRADIVAGGRVDLHAQLVEPTLLRRRLGAGFSYPELYAPVANIATYRDDIELHEFFGSDRYLRRAMYASVYGAGPASIASTEVLAGTLVIDHEDGNRPFGGVGVEASFSKFGPGRPRRGAVLVSEVLARYSEWIGACASA